MARASLARTISRSVVRSEEVRMTAVEILLNACRCAVKCSINESIEQTAPGVDPKHPAITCPGSLITVKPNIAVAMIDAMTIKNVI